jgi:hypothetical protein
MIRPSPAHFRRLFEISKDLYGEARAKATYVRQLRELALRKREKKALEDAVGFTAADAALDAMTARLGPITDELWDLAPSTPHAAAARLLYSAFSESFMDESPEQQSEFTVAIIALEYLRRGLRGLLREHVDELLSDPSREVRSYLFNVGTPTWGRSSEERRATNADV